MGCVFTTKNNIIIKNEISLAPLPKSTIRRIKTDSFPFGFENTNNSKHVHNNDEIIYNLSSLNFGPIKYKLQLKNGKEMEVLANSLNKLFGSIKGFLFRKKYDDYLKTQLMDYTNELYFQFIILTKNYKSSKILNSKKNTKLENILKTPWSDFYIKDPTIVIKGKINQSKNYQNGLIFKYKNKNFDSSNIRQCLENAESCYKGSVDIFNNKKNGYGELINIDGTQQIGTFYNDDFCGWNILINNSGILYVGLFNKGLLVGKGIKYELTNNYLYKGDFKNFKKDGYGEEDCKDYKYKGQYDDDKKNGRGEIIIKNNNDIYKGNFSNDEFNGKGNYKWSNIKKEYNGNFVNGKMHGNGLLQWDDNMYFKGLFNNGLKEGKGEFGFINGCKFFFDFKNDFPCEKGYLQDKNNKLFQVFYSKGKIIDKNMREIDFKFK